MSVMRSGSSSSPERVAGLRPRVRMKGPFDDLLAELLVILDDDSLDHGTGSNRAGPYATDRETSVIPLAGLLARRAQDR